MLTKWQIILDLLTFTTDRENKFLIRWRIEMKIWQTDVLTLL